MSFLFHYVVAQGEKKKKKKKKKGKKKKGKKKGVPGGADLKTENPGPTLWSI